MFALTTFIPYCLYFHGNSTGNKKKARLSVKTKIATRGNYSLQLLLQDPGSTGQYLA